MPDRTASARYQFGRFELQPDERCLLADDVPVPLRPRALELLILLVEHATHLVTKAEILERVWPRVVVEENSIQAQISILRKVIGADAIATLSGQGYRFMLPVVSVVTKPKEQTWPPLPLTRFIGREHEITELRLRATATRLLTLVGPGGCGKTRLVMETAAQLLDDRPDGVQFVELAPLHDPALVARAVGKAFGITPAPGRDLVDTIAEWISTQRLMLVLDNAEHVLEACALVADRLLRRCSELAIIVTSREPLGIDGECIYRVPPLDLPSDEGTSRVFSCESVRLFVDRARLQKPDFEPADKDVLALASICRRLDGIALAIELAAAQVRIMPLEFLNARLDQRFSLLNSGSRTAMPRHRTLRALIDWSHDLLSDDERILFRRLSVFSGGWTLDAAEHVCSGVDFGRDEVINLLSALERKSLVMAELGGATPRFGMLETVREYAQHQLIASTESAAMHGALLDHLTSLASGLDTDGNERGSLAFILRLLDAEHDNLRVALAWCKGERARSLAGLRLAALLYEFWRTRGLHAEGLDWLAALQAACPTDYDPEVQAMAFHASGALLGVDGNQGEAASRLRKAVAVWSDLDNPRQMARSLVCLTQVEWYGGNADAAHAACSRALPISRALGDQRSVIEALHYLAEMARVSGDHDTAAQLLIESLGISQDLDIGATAASFAYLAALDYSRGDYATSLATWRKSLPGYRDMGDRQGLCAALMSMAVVTEELGDLPEAMASLSLAWEQLPGGNDNELMYWLDVFATLLAAGATANEATDSARMLGCLARHSEERGLTRPDTLRHRRTLVAIRKVLGEEAAFDRAWQEGLRWSLDEARNFAREALQLR